MNQPEPTGGLLIQTVGDFLSSFRKVQIHLQSLLSVFEDPASKHTFGC